MRKAVITFGFIAGAIGSACMFTGMIFFEKGHTDTTRVLGYTSLLLSALVTFVGIKRFRDKHNGGVVSFGKAFLAGLYISLIASTLYVIVWALEYKFVFPDFLDKYSAVMSAKARASGASPEKIAEKLKDLDWYCDMYKNPVFFTLITYAQFLPGGLIISLVVALILKRRSKKNTTAANGTAKRKKRVTWKTKKII